MRRVRRKDSGILVKVFKKYSLIKSTILYLGAHGKLLSAK